MATIPAHFNYPGTPGRGPPRTKAGVQYRKGARAWGRGLRSKVTDNTNTNLVVMMTANGKTVKARQWSGGESINAAVVFRGGILTRHNKRQFECLSMTTSPITRFLSPPHPDPPYLRGEQHSQFNGCSHKLKIHTASESVLKPQRAQQTSNPIKVQPNEAGVLFLGMCGSHLDQLPAIKRCQPLSGTIKAPCGRASFFLPSKSPATPLKLT